MEKTNTKKRVGIFSLTCDEGCSIFLTEIFNQKLIPWLEKMELVYFLAIKDHVEIENLDMALVEGVVTSQKDKEKIELIRANTKILIAMGTCAMTALPSGQRNNFNIAKLKEIEGHLEKYDFLPKALALKDVVKVDDEIAGCPIDREKFIDVFEKYLS
jgi:sulfhydrogenase subunit delta